MFTRQRLKKLVACYGSKKWDELHRVALKLSKSTDDVVRVEAFRYSGLAYYKTKHYEQAIEAFTQLTSIVSYRTDWFNLAMCYVRLSDFGQSEKAFQKIYSSPAIKGYQHQIPVPMMLQLYATELADKLMWKIAISRITELKQMYIASNTADEHKLLNAGLPPINSFYRLAIRILEHAEQPDPTKWFGEIKRLKPVFDAMH